VLVSILIPCFNEEDGLVDLFRELDRLPSLLGPEHFPEMVFVDDGSTDGTAKALYALADRAWYPVRVLVLETNQGIGAAIREGGGLVTGEVVITCDADLAYPIEDVRGLLDELLKGFDLVTASPWHPKGDQVGLSFPRWLFSRAASFAYRLRFGARARSIRTFTCGFRAYRAELFQRVLPKRNGFVATAEMLVAALRLKMRIAEIPSKLRVRTTGSSKMRVVRTAFRHAGLLLRGK
jgi:dolichol-phosphate mannosyltransferase